MNHHTYYFIMNLFPSLNEKSCFMPIIFFKKKLTHIHPHTYTCIHRYIFHINTQISYLKTHKKTHVSTHIYIYIHTCRCTYIHTYTQIHRLIHKHMYIHIYTYILHLWNLISSIGISFINMTWWPPRDY